MVEVCADGEAAAQDIVSREIDAERAGARCRLRVGAFDAAYERLRVLQRELGVERQVIRYARLRTFHLKHRVESYYLVSGAESQPPGRGFYHLTGRCVERQRALVAVLGVECHLIVERYGHTYERRETLRDGYRRNVVGRRRYRLSRSLVEYESAVAVGTDPVEVR